jgi:hypothetical protein
MIGYIGKHAILIDGRFASIVQFSAGERGKKEAGIFAFWTAILKVPVKGPERLVKKIIARAKVGLSGTERFDRMAREAILDRNAKNRKIYRFLYSYAMKSGSNVSHIRPSTEREMLKWLSSHKNDAKYALYKSVGGKLK